MLPVTRSIRFVFNDDKHGLMSNPQATAYLRDCLKGQILRYEPILYGDVLILEKGDRM